MSARMDIIPWLGAPPSFTPRRQRDVSRRQSDGGNSTVIASPIISNGTCYSAPGQQMSDSFLPCGNTYYGVETCCYAGDLCLDQHACFNIDLQTAYLAGCTDEDYQRDSCPNKGDYANDTWVGIVYCKGDPNEWIYCPQPEAPTAVTTDEICLCPTATSERTPAFTHSETIEVLSSLPLTEGGTILSPASRFYIDGSRWPTSPAATSSSVPTSSSTSSSSTLSSSSHSVSSTAAPIPATVTVTATPTAATSSAAAYTGGNAHRNGMIAGSVVGAAAALFAVVLAFLYFCVILPRRKERQKQIAVESGSFSPEEFDPYEVAGHSSDLPRPGPAITSDGANPYYLPVADAGSYHHLPHMAEAYLPVAHMGPPRPKFELDAGPWAMRSELDGSSTDVSQVNVPRLSQGTPTSFDHVPLRDDLDIPPEISPVKSPVSAQSAQRGTMYSVVSSQFSFAGPSENILATADAADDTRQQRLGEEEEGETRPKDRPLSSMLV